VNWPQNDGQVPNLGKKKQKEEDTFRLSQRWRRRLTDSQIVANRKEPIYSKLMIKLGVTQWNTVLTRVKTVVLKQARAMSVALRQ
jgi:hypothetical protein